LPAPGGALLVLLTYRERPCRSVPLAGDPADPAGGAAPLRPSRIAETFEVTLAPSPAAEAGALARVERVRNRWRLDPAFKPARPRR
jgi:hypothetical protein